MDTDLLYGEGDVETAVWQRAPGRDIRVEVRGNTVKLLIESRDYDMTAEAARRLGQLLGDAADIIYGR